MPVIADVRADLQIGVPTALLHGIAGRTHVHHFESHMLDRAHHFAVVLCTRGRVVRIKWREFGFEIPVGAWRLDVITARSRYVATAAEPKLVLIERHH